MKLLLIKIWLWRARRATRLPDWLLKRGSEQKGRKNFTSSHSVKRRRVSSTHWQTHLEFHRANGKTKAKAKSKTLKTKEREKEKKKKKKRNAILSFNKTVSEFRVFQTIEEKKKREHNEIKKNSSHNTHTKRRRRNANSLQSKVQYYINFVNVSFHVETIKDDYRSVFTLPSCAHEGSNEFS